MQNIEEIYKQYSLTVYKYILCLSGGNKDMAEEITQETFVVAVQRIKDFRGDSKISVWLCQIAKFIWYKETKRHKKIKFEELDSIEDSVYIEDIQVQKEEKLLIYKNLQKLDEKTRDVMYLRLMGDLNFNEIAEVLGKTANWARVTYYRGKEKIKEESKNEGTK